MKISWMKYEKDAKSFRLPQALGFDVFSLKEPEEVDSKLRELVQNQYDTIILSNELAGFSQDIIKKYAQNKDVKIIISLDRDKL
ncbi:MAG: hypothetical protein IJ777_01565 [Clostridia bacterium]|nr:hypothetical protein [Clostridia bacterium]